MEIRVDKRAAHAELLRRDLKRFVREFWDCVNNEPLIWNWHLDVLCEELMYLSRRVYNKQPKTGDSIINVPPGTSKTKVCSVLATCWDFANKPSIKEFVGSYSDSAALSIAYDIRTVMRSEKYKELFPEVQINKDFDTKHEFRTSEGGHFFAFTVGGTLTSKHADILKVDDPLNPNEINSTARLEETNRFFDRTLPSRKTDKAMTPTVLIMQRLSQNDSTAHLLAKKGSNVRHICLPAEESDVVKPAHLRSNYVNGLLDPVRLNSTVLADMATDLGSANYAAQFAQDPTPEGGTIWRPEYFIAVPDTQFPSRGSFSTYGFDWDTAVTDKNKNAASAYVAGGTIKNNLYIDSVDFAWLEFPELVKWMARLRGPHYIENKSSGRDLKTTLTRNGINAVLVDVPAQDKEARARQATPTAEAGRLFVRQSVLDKLLNDKQQGVLRFPNSKHKDLADALSQFVLRNSKRPTVIATSGGKRDILEELFLT